jgi:hypothetical protein
LSRQKLTELLRKGRDADPIKGIKRIQPHSEEEIEAKLAKRAEKRSAKKANKTAHAAGGVPGKSPAQLKAERDLAQEVLRQATQAYKEAQESGADQATLGEAKIRMLQAKVELTKLNPGQGAGNGKKKKHVKVPLSEDERTQLRGIVKSHTEQLRHALLDSKSHSQYSEALHSEFVDFAQRKYQFYADLKESPSQKKKVKIALEIFEKAKVREVDKKSWPQDTFEEFKRIMLKYRREIDEYKVSNLQPKQKRERQKALLKARTQEIETLLTEANLKTVKREVMRAQR